MTDPTFTTRAGFEIWEATMKHRARTAHRLGDQVECNGITGRIKRVRAAHKHLMEDE